jgi:putative transcriptional regulator
MSTHGAEGAMGVVLNRPLGKRLGELKGDFALGPLSATPIFTGRPGADRPADPGRLAAASGDAFQLHFGIDPEKAVQMLADESTRLRAYLGYSGWSAGQLETSSKRNMDRREPPGRPVRAAHAGEGSGARPCWPTRATNGG